MTVLVVTYHAVERGEGPLFVAPELFESHLDTIVRAGVETLTVADAAARLAAGLLPERGVTITFDDGLRSVYEHAAPLLRERGFPATVFCVAGKLGGESDWPPADGPRLPLMSAQQVAALASDGFEIGSHGMNHVPLADAPPEVLHRELVESRAALERTAGVPVRSFASPYGSAPGDAALVARTYDAACTTRFGAVSAEASPLDLPRVDAHYLRRPDRLERALLDPQNLYLRARGLGARARRVVVKDYAN
jgi:peptidoglycan/xylan/chitin deacetylase (PgdA/CDA1 family)